MKLVISREKIVIDIKGKPEIPVILANNLCKFDPSSAQLENICIDQSGRGFTRKEIPSVTSENLLLFSISEGGYELNYWNDNGFCNIVFALNKQQPFSNLSRGELFRLLTKFEAE